MQTSARLRTVASLSLGVLLLTLGINALSAWIRHNEAGLACVERPACYGLIGGMVESAAAVARATGASRAALSPQPVAKRVHRALASALVVVVLVLLHRARSPNLLRGREMQLPYLMAALLLGLAVIGPASYLKTLPAVATANLVGGILLAAAAWRLWLGTAGVSRVAATAAPSRRLLDVTLLVLLAQIALGAWQSANFAGLACAGGRACHATASAGQFANAFWYLRELPLDATGRVLAEPAATLIHLAHRGGALLTTLLVATLSVRVLRTVAQLRVEALIALLLLGAQLLLGACALAFELPLPVVLAHHTLATLLLLTVLRLRYRLQTEPAR